MKNFVINFLFGQSFSPNRSRLFYRVAEIKRQSTVTFIQNEISVTFISSLNVTWKRKSGNFFIPDTHRHDRKQFFSRRWQHWCSFRLACLVMIAAHWIIWKIARQAARCGIIMCKRKSLYFKVNARREHACIYAYVPFVRAYRIRACLYVRACVSACVRQSRRVNRR